jgi:peroxiredoxin
MAIESPICDFGWKAVDFRLEGTDGRFYSLANVQGVNGTLIMFICNHCPYVKAIIDRLVRDVKELQTLGIGAIAVMSNDVEQYPEDSFAHMQEFAVRHGFSFPYVIDPTQEIARNYDAVCTPDFFGFNAAFELQYRGRLDASGREAGPNDAKRELFEAMREVAKNRRGPGGQIPSMGCSIKWREK